MSEIGDKIRVGTDVYIAFDDEYQGCNGCNAEDDVMLCGEILDRVNCGKCIWIKQQPAETQATTYNQTKGEPEMNTDKIAENTTEEPKYTLAEFIEAYNAYIADNDTTLGTRDAFISKYLLRFSSPEYQEYLRLKAIFG